MNEIIVRGGLLGENLFIIDDIEIPNPNHFGQPGTGGSPVNLIHAEFGDKASSVMNIKFREESLAPRYFQKTIVSRYHFL